MASNKGIKVVFGGGIFGFGSLNTPELANQVGDKLAAAGIDTIDTAQRYGASEEVIGQAELGKRFTIDTKDLASMDEEGVNPDRILARAKKSQELLKTKVDVFYLHTAIPRETTAETLAAVQKVYESGFFKRFGLSNFLADQVQEVYDHCKAHNYVLPTVYQGNYNPVGRRQEDVLFPTLRKLGISFYAYSPVAGGFLTKDKEQVLAGAGRFDTSTFIGQLYSKLYSKPELLEALGDWAAAAEEEGVSRAELALRWVRFNSDLKFEQGDALIAGPGTFEQIDSTLKSLEAGPLSAKAVQRIDDIWAKIKDIAPLDNVNG